MDGLSSSIQSRPKAAAFQLVTNTQDKCELINWVPRIKASICNLASAGSSPHSLLPQHIAPSCPHVTNGKMQGENVLQLCGWLGLRSLRERAPFNSALPLVPMDTSELLNPSWPRFLQQELQPRKPFPLLSENTLGHVICEVAKHCHCLVTNST